MKILRILKNLIILKQKKIFSGINKFWVVNENNKLKYCNKPCDDVWYDANINSDIKTISSNINNWDNNGLADLAIRGDSISSDEFNNINDAQDKCNKLTECYAINKLPNNKFKLMSNGFAEKKDFKLFYKPDIQPCEKVPCFLKKEWFDKQLYIFTDKEIKDNKSYDDSYTAINECKKDSSCKGVAYSAFGWDESVTELKDEFRLFYNSDDTKFKTRNNRKVWFKT